MVSARMEANPRSDREVPGMEILCSTLQDRTFEIVFAAKGSSKEFIWR